MFYYRGMRTTIWVICNCHAINKSLAVERNASSIARSPSIYTTARTNACVDNKTFRIKGDNGNRRIRECSRNSIRTNCHFTCGENGNFRIDDKDKKSCSWVRVNDTRRVKSVGRVFYTPICSFILIKIRILQETGLRMDC